jgi:hypothetical protein
VRPGADPPPDGLKILQLHNTGVTNKGLECLRKLRSLRAVEIYSEPFLGNECLAVLKDLPYLEYLDLDAIATDAGFKYLGQFPSLRWLRIRTGRVWGPGLTELANLPCLERLCLWGTDPISDRHLHYLEGLRRLKSLTLWGVADPLTDASLASIGKLTSLEELYFIRTIPQFTPAAVACLRGLRHLQKVEFGLSWAGPSGMKTLATLPNLRCLHVALKDRHQGYSGPTGVSYLTRLTRLEELAFTGGQSLSDADLAHFESLTSLRNLLGSGNITDRGLTSLGKLHRLEHLTFYTGGGVSKRGLNELSGLTNLQTLSVHDNYVWRHPEAEARIDEIPLNLSTLTNLKTLDLAGFALEEGDLACLGGLPHVEWMTLQGSVLPETALRHLKDLPALKRLTIDRIDCSDGSGLAALAGLRRLEDLTLRGRVTDLALRGLAGVTAPHSITAWTNEPIRPATIHYLKRTLPALEYIHLEPLPEMGKPAIRPSSGQQGRIRGGPLGDSRPAPRRPQRQR